MDNSTIIVANYNETNEIDSTLNWIEIDNDERLLLSCYYDYDNYYYIIKLDTPKNEENLNINCDFVSKYIGLRKMIKDEYVYGWIQLTIEKNETLVFERSSFYNQYLNT